MKRNIHLLTYFLLILLVFPLGLLTAQEETPEDTPADISEDTAQATPTPVYNNVRDNVESIQMEKWQQELQTQMGNFQLAWPIIKQLQNMSKSQIVQESPECWASAAIDFIGQISIISMLLRLGNMVSNAILTNNVLSEMECLVLEGGEARWSTSDNPVSGVYGGCENKNPNKELNHAKFFSLMVQEYRIHNLYALIDLIADSYDLAMSSTELIMTIAEIAQWPPILCTPKR